MVFGNRYFEVDAHFVVVHRKISQYEKKALILIVEGETDEAVFEPMLKGFYPRSSQSSGNIWERFYKKENYKKSPKTIVGEIVSTFKDDMDINQQI